MLRFSPSSPLLLFLLTGLLTCSSASAQDTDNSAGSVDKLRMLLHSIDPYKPHEVVSGEIQLFGSSTMDSLAHAWGDNFKEFHPEICIEVSSMGDSAGAERMVTDPGGIWMVSRPVKAEELDALRAGGIQQPVAIEVARQALGVFVHPSNPVTTISGEQLRTIFVADSAVKPTWRLLGATGSLADQAIHIVSRDADSGTQKFLQENIFAAPLRSSTTVKSNAKIVNAIENDPLAIGICGLRCGSAQARPLNLEVGGSVIPSDDLAILSGQYPLIRPLSIVIDLANPDIKRSLEFVRYVLSQSGQAENVLAGYYPIDLPLIRAAMAKLQDAQSSLR